MKMTMMSTALACVLAGACVSAQAVCGEVIPAADSQVSANGDGTFTYEVSISGDSGACGVADRQSLVDFYLPYFSDMGVTDVSVPTGWTYSIEATHDVFGIGGGAIDFHSDVDDQILAGFSFQAGYDGTEGPFRSNLFDEVTGQPIVVWGDPLIPGSPDTLQALSAVPEPGVVSSMLAGLALLGAARVRRRR